MNPIEQENRRRRSLGEPPMTPEQENQFLQTVKDTRDYDLREAGRGSVETTPKGTRVKDGQYKGMTEPQMNQAILTGAAPPTGKSGYVRGGPLLPPRPSALPRPAASSAPALPPGGRMVAGRTTGGQVYVPPGEKAWFEQTPSAPAASAPANPPPAVTIPAINISSSAPPRAPLANAGATTPRSPVSPRPQGKIDGMPANQWLQDSANRQGVANSYGTVKPTAIPPAAPKLSLTAAEDAQMMTSAAALQKAATTPPSPLAGPPRLAAPGVSQLLAAGPPSVLAAPAAARPATAPPPAPTSSRLDPIARTAATMSPTGRTPQAAAPPAIPRTPAPLEFTPLSESDSSTIRGIAADSGTFNRKIAPVLNPAQWTPQSKAAPILAKAGVSVPTSYPNPAARVAGDNESVLGLEKAGQITMTKTKDAGGVVTPMLQVGTPRPPVPSAEPSSMMARQMPRITPPPTSTPRPPRSTLQKAIIAGR